jgi:hypothetical protein
MIVWRITGNEIGPNGNGAAHFATKAEAERAKKEYQSDDGGAGNIAGGPFRVVVRTRQQLADALDEAMGFGAT